MPRTDPESRDVAWLDAAARLSFRGRVRSRPNPCVGAILVADGRIVGRGWTQPGGRPHAEAMALEAAGPHARGSTAYVTLEPCAHDSERGPACADRLVAAGVSRVVIGCEDPDPRTAGKGAAMLRKAGIDVTPIGHGPSRDALNGYLTRARHGRPFVTLKLAFTLDGKIALANGESRWITGPEARAHAHLERASHDAILVGGGTMRADAPSLDVRLSGLEGRSPQRWVLTRGNPPAGWSKLSDPADLSPLLPAQYLMVEGGGEAAAAFLRAGHADRLLIYRAPVLIGADGIDGLSAMGLTDLGAAHGRWALADRRTLGSDTMEDYRRVPCSPE